MPNIEHDRVSVAAGILIDEDGRVLIAQRVYPDHFFGKWEFPGGKIETSETTEQALRRELKEELGISVGGMERWMTVHRDYPDRKITLNVLRVMSYEGVPSGREGQALLWLRPLDLDNVDFLTGNRPIVRALQMPDQYVITDVNRFGREKTMSRLDDSMPIGSLIQVREKAMSSTKYQDFVRELVAKARSRGAKVLLNAASGKVLELGADGMHLSSARLQKCKHRPLPDQYWVAASCHNEFELRMAEAIDVDFVVLGPVSKTESHSMATTLGWEGFAGLCAKTSLSVYAIGGMRPEDTGRAKHAGGKGVAMITAFWNRSPD